MGAQRVCAPQHPPAPPQPAAPGARSGCEPLTLHCNPGSGPSPLQRKFYISLNFKPSLPKCQFLPPVSKIARRARPLPAPWMERGHGDAQGTGSAVGNIPLSSPSSPPRRPPTWSCGQFNQPSFPKLSQPARAIVTAGKNRQAPFTRGFMGSSYSLVQANFKAGCCPLIPAKLPWTNNGLKAIQLSLSSTMHFISHSVLSSV